MLNAEFVKFYALKNYKVKKYIVVQLLCRLVVVLNRVPKITAFNLCAF